MIVHRVAIISLAIACASDTGCRTTDFILIPPDVRATTTSDTSIESPIRASARDRTFTIAFVTFIPANHLVAPAIHPQSYGRILPPMRLAFAGDDRSFDIDATSYRAKQVVTVIPDESEDADGLVEGSRQNLGGISESFHARLALADGRIDERDRTSAPGGCRIKRGEVEVDPETLIIDDPIRLGPHCIFIRLRTASTGGPRNRLIAGSPSIDWDIGITLDTSGPEAIYGISGWWDGYPAAELYINRQPVFTFMPAGEPGSCRDLVKLLSGYGDVHFERRGVRSTSPESVKPVRRNVKNAPKGKGTAPGKGRSSKGATKGTGVNPPPSGGPRARQD